MRRDDQVLGWQDVQSGDLVIVADDDPVLALGCVPDVPATSAAPAPAWDVRDPPTRLWTTQNVRTLYTSTLQDLGRQLAAYRQRRTPHVDW
ncbi:MAG: hypothetical protein IT177_09675 [Acidobacteria bacterium]|nr:hypothetical protein [Acidobacteriota bacterium]